jgi:hypothetical protein
MKVEIENYRGWNISFDTEKEVFYCHSDQRNMEQKKNSYSSIKKWIDDFIKENDSFNPVWIEHKRYGYILHDRMKLIGIRKDGHFLFEDKDGDKRVIAFHNEMDYMLHTPENDKYKEEAKKIDAELEELRSKRNAIFKKFVVIDLKEYKKQILGQNAK